jgi:hypothetical protein
MCVKCMLLWVGRLHDWMQICCDDRSPLPHKAKRKLPLGGTHDNPLCAPSPRQVRDRSIRSVSAKTNMSPENTADMAPTANVTDRLFV